MWKADTACHSVIGASKAETSPLPHLSLSIVIVIILPIAIIHVTGGCLTQAKLCSSSTPLLFIFTAKFVQDASKPSTACPISGVQVQDVDKGCRQVDGSKSLPIASRASNGLAYIQCCFVPVQHL